MIATPRVFASFLVLIMVGFVTAVALVSYANTPQDSAAARCFREARKYAKANLYDGTGAVESLPQKGRNDAVEVGPGIWKVTGHMRKPARGSQFVADVWVVYLDTKTDRVLYATGNQRVIGDETSIRSFAQPARN